MQQIQPAYIRQGSTGCLNVPVFGVDLSNTFVVSILFKGTVIVCTTTRVFDGLSPLVVVDDRYKGRVSCGVDEGLNQISVCFTSAVYLDDGGRYFASTSTTSNNTLYVMAPPRKPTIQTQNIIISGTFHSFTCSSVSTSTPAPGLPLSFEWSVNHVRILDPRFAVAGTRGETLTLNKVQKQDNGTVLYCTVMEEKGLNSEMSDQEMLNVLYVPEIVIIPSTKLTVQVNDDNVHLMCSVIDANPNTDLKFVWTKDSTQIGTRQNYTIVSVHNADRGTYTCTCSNTAGASAPASVIVDLLGYTGTPSDTTIVSDTDRPTTSIYTTSTGYTGPPSNTTIVSDTDRPTTSIYTTSTDDTGHVSSSLLYISLFGSLSLFSIGIIVFLIIISVCQKKCKKSHLKSKTTYVMGELWREDSHPYSTTTPSELTRENQKDSSSGAVMVNDYTETYIEILEDNLDQYLTFDD
ncbi:uncharacterized protein LOC111126940 isoform X2 [Crassostrea virginica]